MICARARKLLLLRLGAALIHRHLARRAVLVPAGPRAVECAASERALRLLLPILVVGDCAAVALAVDVLLFEAQLPVRVPLLRGALLPAGAVFLAARGLPVGVPGFPDSLAAIVCVGARDPQLSVLVPAPVGALHRAVLEVGLDAHPLLLVPGHARAVLAVLRVLAPLAHARRRRLPAELG